MDKYTGDIIKSFSCNGNEESLENIISDLKFISKIKPQERINMTSMTISGSDYYSRVYRTLLMTEDRGETLKFCRSTIQKAIDLLYYYSVKDEKFYKNLAGILITSLEEAKGGLGNLMLTYGDDRMFTAKIEALLATMDVKINKK